MAFDWKDLIEPGVGALGGIVGNKIQAGASEKGVKENARQFDISTQRSDAARNMLLPTLRTNLGYRGGNGVGMLGASGYPGTPPFVESQGGSGLGKVASIAGKVGMAANLPIVGGLAGGVPGLGMLGALPGVGALGPAAPIGAGVLLAKSLIGKIGQGRKAANRLTQGGAQDQFGQLMQAVSQRGLPKEQEQAILSRALGEKIQQAIAAAKNGNDRKVIRQWIGDFSQPKWAGNGYLAGVANQYAGQVA